MAATREDALVGYGPPGDSGETFARRVQDIDPQAKTVWIGSDQLNKLNAIGVCYRPDLELCDAAMLRLRAGPARYAICGVTHTISRAPNAREIAGYLSAPVMPWDALICTSSAAHAVVEHLLQEQADYLAWRFGAHLQLSRPQLPVIPLGVHCADFDFSTDQRAAARLALGVDQDEVVALYAGRLAFADKAHPFAMYLALQAAAERTGKRLVLIQAGRYFNELAEQAFRSGASDFCPDVRVVVVDGLEFAAYQDAWAAADIFVSASDSVQESFGLTPLEAMAAGLPCVVSDWNGYRDTVRDGVDGLRIRTWAPDAGAGEALAMAHETGRFGDGYYVWGVTSTVSVDISELTDRLVDLVESPDLRKRMGASGRARARSDFDWADIYRRYKALWAELTARRLSIIEHPESLAALVAAPRASVHYQDPFRTFSHYATSHIGSGARLRLSPGGSVDRYRVIARHSLFFEAGLAALQGAARTDALAIAVLTRLAAGETTVGDLARKAHSGLDATILVVATLAKMGLLELSGPVD